MVLQKDNVNNKDGMQDGEFSYAHDCLPIVQMLNLALCSMMQVSIDVGYTIYQKVMMMR
jgi:hypothetical protein